MNRLYIGVDIGGTTTKFGIFLEDGIILEQWEVMTDTAEGGSHILPVVAREIYKKIKTAEYEEDQLMGIGMGVPGPILEDGYLNNCVNLGWGKLNPAMELERLMNGIPVIAGNDANVAALGEYWQGRGKGHRNMVFITLGTGVGSGIILDGKMLYGAKGLGGEIGHISVNPDETEVCNCGHRGCLDQMASATGIVRNAMRFLQYEDTESTLREYENLTAKKVLDAAKQGDRIAEKTVQYCMQFLGKSISDISYTVDPEIFVIGGGVSKAGEYLIRIIRNHYEVHAQLVPGKAQIELATLGNEAGIYGAAKLIRDYVETIGKEGYQHYGENRTKSSSKAAKRLCGETGHADGRNGFGTQGKSNGSDEAEEFKSAYHLR